MNPGYHFYVFWGKITEFGFPHTKLNSVGRKLVKPWNYIPLMKHLPKYVVGAGDVFVRVQYVQERGFQTRAYCANVPLKREKRGTTYYYLAAF